MPPLTQFEIDGEWTSLATEAAFWQQVAAETPATLTVAGQSTGGRDIYRIDLGAGTRHTMMISSLIHGDEVASREALMAWLRDLAYSTDPAVLDYLTRHRIVAVVPVNPDGFPNSRIVPNSGGRNINRDVYRLELPETRALMSVVASVRPNFYLDIHEYHGTSPTQEDYWGRGGGNPITHPAIQALEQDCYGTVEAAALAGGYTAAPYPYNVTMRAGFSTVAGPMHTVGMLNETNMEHPRDKRVAIQRLGLEAVREWHEVNAAACEAASEASRAAARSNTASVPLYTHQYLGQDLNPPRLQVAGYRPAEPLPLAFRSTFGILTQEDGTISMQQDAQPVIPTLLDPESPDVRVPAERITRTVPAGKRPVSARVNTASHGTRDVDTAHLHVDGAKIPVRFTG